MFRIITDLIALVILSFLLVQDAYGAKRCPPGTTNIQALSADVRSILPKKTRLAPKIPICFVTYDEVAYVELEHATAYFYDIEIGLQPGCHGGQACALGYFTAKRSDVSAKKGTRVKLSRTVYGYYDQPRCRSYCPMATLSWLQDGILYTIGLKAGDKREMMLIARSAWGSGCPPH